MRSRNVSGAYFGGSEALMKGGAPKIDELTVAWALEAPQLAPNVTPRVMADVGSLNLPMVKVGTSGVYAAVANLSHGAAMTWHYEAGPDRRLGGSQLEVYETHPDSRERPDVPKGTVKQMPPWQSKIFDGTKRDWWVYVPAQYRPENPAGVMVFQDGAGPKDYVPTVFDNLIAKGDMPVTVGIFINPGIRADGGRESAVRVRHAVRSVRALSARRDSAGSREDGKPSPRRRQPRHLGREQRRHLFLHRRLGAARRIQQGALVDRQLHEHRAGQTLRAGGHNYEALVRKTIPRKPIRVFLQDGENDLDNANGNWPLANQTLAKVAVVRGLRLQVRTRPRLSQQPSRPRHSARFAALAVARLSALKTGTSMPGPGSAVAVAVRDPRCAIRSARCGIRGSVVRDPWCGIRDPRSEVRDASLRAGIDWLQPPRLVKEALRLDKQRKVLVIVSRLGHVDDGPVGQFRRLHVVVGLIVKRETAVDDDVLFRIERIGKNQHRHVIGVEPLGADGDSVDGPSNWKAIGDAAIDGIARRVAKERQVVIGNVIRRDVGVVLDARFAAEEMNPFRDRILRLVVRPPAYRLREWLPGRLHENKRIHERIVNRPLQAMNLAKAAERSRFPPRA